MDLIATLWLKVLMHRPIRNTGYIIYSPLLITPCYPTNVRYFESFCIDFIRFSSVFIDGCHVAVGLRYHSVRKWPIMTTDTPLIRVGVNYFVNRVIFERWRILKMDRAIESDLCSFWSMRGIVNSHGKWHCLVCICQGWITGYGWESEKGLWACTTQFHYLMLFLQHGNAMKHKIKMQERQWNNRCLKISGAVGGIPIE